MHIPGSIQPHGVLLVVDPDNRRIVQIAGECARFFGQKCAVEQNAALADIERGLGAKIPLDHVSSEPRLIAASERFDVVAHARDGVILLEFEPRAAAPKSGAEILADVRQIATDVAEPEDLQGVLDIAVAQARRITGYDRAMIYRFLEDGAGTVVAEEKEAELPPFLQLHYPASDIPQQARALYLRSPIRVIPDVTYAPAPLVPPDNPKTVAPLDMSDCGLRSVSPIHVQYLRNMGVGASLSISIVVEGALWGLIACHNRTAKFIAYESRELCTHLGQLLSQQIEARERDRRNREAQTLAARRSAFIAQLTASHSVDAELARRADELMNLVPAEGAAIVLEAGVHTAGVTPTPKQIKQIADWLPSGPGASMATHRLVGLNERAANMSAVASGLIAVQARGEGLILMWFRPERVETVHWAGNPDKAVHAGQSGALTPRSSFEAWKQTVRQQAKPWTGVEIAAARALGAAIDEVRSAEALSALNVQLRRALDDKERLLAQKDLLVREVHHRVQNGLQLVHSMLHLQGRHATEDARVQLSEASRRIMAVAAVHRRLWKSEDIAAVDFALHLRELCDDLIAAWGEVWREHLRIDAESALMPTERAIPLALIVTEVLTNAVKYAYAGEPGLVEINLSQDGDVVKISVADRGRGIPKNAGSGLGSRLINSLTAQLSGAIDITSNAKGTKVSIAVPTATPAVK